MFMSIPDCSGSANQNYIGNTGNTTVNEKEGLSRQGFRIYPNPANSTVTIELEEGMPSDGLVVFLNAQGKEVLRKILPASTTKNTFSVEGLLPGLFYIEVRDGNHNTLQQSKLIISR